MPAGYPKKPGPWTEKERLAIESRLTKDANDCLVWQGYRFQSGHGGCQFGGVTKQVHLAVWIISGRTIPNGYVIHHMCRNLACANISHLCRMTKSESSLLGNVGKITGKKNLEKTRCPKGHPYSGDNLYINPKSGRICNACVRESCFRSYQKHKDKRRAAAIKDGKRRKLMPGFKEYKSKIDRIYRNTPAGRASHKASRHNRMARSKNGDGISAKEIRSLMGATKTCPDCGGRFSKQNPKSLDHVIALADGGEHSITNARIICKRCNSIKGCRRFSSNGQGILI